MALSFHQSEVGPSPAVQPLALEVERRSGRETLANMPHDIVNVHSGIGYASEQKVTRDSHSRQLNTALLLTSLINLISIALPCLCRFLLTFWLWGLTSLPTSPKAPYVEAVVMPAKSREESASQKAICALPACGVSTSQDKSMTVTVIIKFGPIWIWTIHLLTQIRSTQTFNPHSDPVPCLNRIIITIRLPSAPSTSSSALYSHSSTWAIQQTLDGWQR